MPSCALRYCVNNSRNISKSQGVTFHKFPNHGHEKRESWIRFVQNNRREETWLPSEYSRVCSKHFKEDDKYTTKTGRLYLKKSAVPCDNPITCIKLEVTDPLSDPLDNESDSSAYSILDSPRKIVLKEKLRKQFETTKKLSQKCKKIKRQNIYLKKKCASYKAIILKLKDKYGVANLNVEN